MSTNNTVNKVLFISNESGGDLVMPIDEGKKVSELSTAGTVGAWGLFNYDTGKSVLIDRTKPTPNNWFLASRYEDGTIHTTSGTHIQTRNIKYMTRDIGTNAESQIIELSNITAESGPDATNYDYGIKLDFRGNTEVYTRFGYNQASKFFMANTACVGSEGASTDAVNEVLAQLADAISSDQDKFLSFSVLNDATVIAAYDVSTGVWSGSGITDKETALAAIRTFAVANPDLRKMMISIGNFSKMYNFCSVNPKYFKQRQIAAVPSLFGATCNWAKFEETTPMKYSKNMGYDIQELEYACGGFDANPGIYRQSGNHGLPFNKTTFVADKTKLYDVITLGYDQFSVGGWQEYLNNQATYIVIETNPDPDTLIDLLDMITVATGINLIP